MRFAKKDYYAQKFSNNNRNPKAAWKTINDIVGRSKKQDEIQEIKLPGKTVILTEELVDVFNEHFVNTGPNLAEIIQMKMMELFKTSLTKKILNILFSQLVLQWFMILLIICRLQSKRC